MVTKSQVIEVSVSAVPHLCTRRNSQELRFTVVRKIGDEEHFVTLRVCGKGAERAISFIRDWIDASLTSGALTMADLGKLDRRVLISRGLYQVLPPNERSRGLC